MNERIKELAKAHLVREEHTEFGWQECHQYSFDEDELTEFAELIVRECATIINDIPSSPQGSWSDGYYEGCRDSAKQIQQHFGVEE